jgi:hypothetical protein
VCAECLFADPVADIAVIGPPDDQQFPEEADAYDELTDHVPALPIGIAQSGKGVAALSRIAPLDSHECALNHGPYGSLEIGPTKSGVGFAHLG